VGLSEEEVLARLQRLKQGGILRQIGAIFDSSRLGYHSTLVALELDPLRMEAAARQLNAHPGISHNYARDHRYNLWFTLTLPQDQDLREEMARLAAEVKAHDFLYLPALAIFKIGVRLKFLESAEEVVSAVPPLADRSAAPAARPLSSKEIRAIRALQIDLPLQGRPFFALAQEAGMEEEELLRMARDLLAEGVMRRFAATLYHRRAGFRHNLLVLWPAPEAHLEEMGRRAAALEEVSHCYQRLTHPHWPYSLYAMFHARTRKEADRILVSLIEVSGKRDYIVLETTKEYKKERVRYFQEDRDGAEI
jgi:DNA-binding Lrp family transcriptional regulator